MGVRKKTEEPLPSMRCEEFDVSKKSEIGSKILRPLEYSLQFDYQTHSLRERRHIQSGASWETIVGYSRAVRVGPVIEVAGTTAVDDHGVVVGPGDPYIQARHILEKIRKALEALGASLEDVVRTRMFVVKIGDWRLIARAHAEVFGEIRPVTTLVEVGRLIEPDLLVEIEVSAWVERDL
jgi:enamine deaminase RidA (YjgF/YER057c/UK114 family)